MTVEVGLHYPARLLARNLSGAMTPTRGCPPEAVTIGILAALPVECAAMAKLIDDMLVRDFPGDPNTYRVGSLPSRHASRPHRVALTMLPRDGTRSAASVCTNLLRTFPNVRSVVMMGIAAGIPRPTTPTRHVRLGDIVVATAGIVDYGHVRQVDGVRRPRRSDGHISTPLVRAANELQMSELDGSRPWEFWLSPETCEYAREYPRPDEATDLLFVEGRRIPHPARGVSGHQTSMPKIHYGAVGSADVLMRDEAERDRLAGEFEDLLAVEMEGSGVAASTAGHDVSWFMVRGVVDYAEATGKNDLWHKHSSYATAAYVRSLLAACRPYAMGLPYAQSGEDEHVLGLVGYLPASDAPTVAAASPGSPEQNPGHHAGAGGGLHASQPPRRPVWGNMPPRNGDFIGRTELLESMAAWEPDGSGTATLALHGRGGIGKTQIAIEYAYRHRAEYEVMWWIPAEQRAQILHSFIELGESLGLHAGQEAGTAVPIVLAALRNGTPFSKWLLIFDDAPSLEAIRPYIPDSRSGRALLTTRSQELADVTPAIEVGVFTRQESIDLLRDRNPDITVAEADRLAEALEDLPLAAAHASIWRATTHAPVGEYLRLLEEKQQELAGQEVPVGYELPVAKVCNVTLDQMGLDNPGALRLLEVSSFFAPEPIGLDLFTSPRLVPIDAELDQTLHDPNRLAKAIRYIERFGLARVDHRAQTIQLHRLVRTVLASRLSEAERGRMRHGAHALVAGGHPGGSAGTDHWPRYHALIPHVVASEMILCTDPWSRKLVLDVIEFYYYWGDHSGCRDLAADVVRAWRAEPGPDDPQTLKATKWLGFALRVSGNFAEAAEINRECLERSQRIAGPDDEETLDAMNMVAADLRAAGDFDAARDLDTKALEASRIAYGANDPSTLAVAHNLGVSLRHAGEFKAALELDTDTCRRRASTLGPDHALTLWTVNGFTLDLRECGEYAQARLEQEKLYERFQRVWGKDHPNTLTAARILAVARRVAGDHDEARQLAGDVFGRLKQRFGALHPETIAAGVGYTVDLRYNGQLAESRRMAVEALDNYEMVFGAQHPHTLYARSNLAIVLRLLGEIDAAHQHNSIAADMLRRRLGPDHPLTLACAINLASDLAGLGRFDQAYELDAKTIERSRRRLGHDHPETLARVRNLALDMIGCGRVEEGERLYEDVCLTLGRVLGGRHPALAMALTRTRANSDADLMPI